MAELDGIILHLAKLTVAGKEIGYISEEGVDWGGDEPQFTEVTAAQTRSVVKKILKKAGTNVMTFKLIQLNVANLVNVMGGKADSGNAAKWMAPNAPVTIEGALKIETVTGQIIESPKVTLDGAIRGTIGGDTPLSVDATITILNDGVNSPFSIQNGTSV